MKANQKGFSVVEILIVIVVVGLLGTVGWLVYDRQKNNTDNKNSTTQTTQQEEKKETTPVNEKVNQFSATSFSLDTNKLPKGWTATNNTADVVTVTSDGCFIEATKENDATLSTSKQEEGVQALITANDKTSSKGYVVADKGTSTLTVSTVSGSEKVTSYEFLWDLPDGGNPFRYSRIYSIQDGYYVSLKRSCSSEAGFANTGAALSALIFKQ
jgi:prepilin-type N-terminal cleavage/methylation domain-containing protein